MNKTIAISTVPEFPAGTVVEPAELFDFIRKTSNLYDYQFQSPRMHRFTDKQPDDEAADDGDGAHFDKAGDKMLPFIVVSRSKVPGGNGQKEHFIDRFYLPFFIFFLIFEAFCISMIIHLSHTITSSITLLEKNTQRIAAGELDIELENPKRGNDSNEITSLTENLEKMRRSLKEDEERRSRFIMSGTKTSLQVDPASATGVSYGETDVIWKKK